MNSQNEWHLNYMNTILQALLKNLNVLRWASPIFLDGLGDETNSTTSAPLTVILFPPKLNIYTYTVRGTMHKVTYTTISMSKS